MSPVCTLHQAILLLTSQAYNVCKRLPLYSIWPSIHITYCTYDSCSDTISKQPLIFCIQQYFIKIQQNVHLFKNIKPSSGTVTKLFIKLFGFHTKQVVSYLSGDIVEVDILKHDPHSPTHFQGSPIHLSYFHYCLLMRLSLWWKKTVVQCTIPFS